jgi:hypothetical protein
MKQVLFILIAFSTCFAFGQSMPKQSPEATVNQEIGLNELAISYARPSAKGRVIFGDLEPYNDVWRLGANECTKFKCSKAIMIGDDELPAGTYGMFAIPMKNQWKIIFNSDSEQWGSYDFDPAKNVLTYTTAVITSAHTETLSICFENLMTTSANIVIRWDNVMVSIPFTTDTPTAVKMEIEAALDKGKDLAKVHYNAADYYMDIDDMDVVNSHLDKSLAIERTYYNVFMKAKIVSEEDSKSARKLAHEAIKLAEKENKEGWANHIKGKSADWK